jgi:hypothetical protein
MIANILKYEWRTDNINSYFAINMDNKIHSLCSGCCSTVKPKVTRGQDDILKHRFVIRFFIRYSHYEY